MTFPQLWRVPPRVVNRHRVSRAVLLSDATEIAADEPATELHFWKGHLLWTAAPSCAMRRAKDKD
jgi:hypothetical protein